MRGLGIGIAVFFGWTTNGFLALFFPALVEAIHINGVLLRSLVASAAPRSVPGRPFQVEGACGDARWRMGHPRTCEPHNARHRRRYRRRRSEVGA
jgi:hypothetical protein